MPDIDLASRLAGGMLGLLVGDAVGVPYEFRTPGAIGTVEFRGHGSHDQPPGTWSDDGALALALADSLLPPVGAADPRAVRFDPDDQGGRIAIPTQSRGTAPTRRALEGMPGLSEWRSRRVPRYRLASPDQASRASDSISVTARSSSSTRSTGCAGFLRNAFTRAR